MIHLNVGGTKITTSKETLSPCKRFETLSNGDSEMFLDRDPAVFLKALKVLRGYPCDELADDLDIISELAWLKHIFLNADLGGWLEEAVHPVDTKDTNHTLDPEQTSRFSKTRVLVASSSLKKLESVGVIVSASDYPKCKVVGVGDDWIDSQWVPCHDFELAKMKLRFLKFFLPHRLSDEPTFASK
jgi:hypothetical protein